MYPPEKGCCTVNNALFAVFTLFVVLSVLFVCDGLWSKLLFTAVTLSAAVIQLINGIKGYISFPAAAEDAWVEYAKPVSWWVQKYNSFVTGIVAVAILFFILHFVLIWLEKKRITKYSVHFTIALAAAASLIIVISAIGFGISHINKYFDFASHLLAAAASVSSLVVLYSAAFVKWMQEKL